MECCSKISFFVLIVNVSKLKYKGQLHSFWTDQVSVWAQYGIRGKERLKRWVFRCIVKQSVAVLMWRSAAECSTAGIWRPEKLGCRCLKVFICLLYLFIGVFIVPGKMLADIEERRTEISQLSTSDCIPQRLVVQHFTVIDVISVTLLQGHSSATGHFLWLVQSPGTVSHWTFVRHKVQKHAQDTSVLSFLLHWLTVSRVRAANTVWCPCSDSSDVTVYYKLSYYYYFYTRRKPLVVWNLFGSEPYSSRSSSTRPSCSKAELKRCTTTEIRWNIPGCLHQSPAQLVHELKSIPVDWAVGLPPQSGRIHHVMTVQHTWPS